MPELYTRMTRMSVLLNIMKTGQVVWIPLSLIHGGSELHLRTAAQGDELNIDIVSWKADQL